MDGNVEEKTGSVLSLMKLLKLGGAKKGRRRKTVGHEAGKIPTANSSQG
jgi:hypothetical protein